MKLLLSSQIHTLMMDRAYQVQVQVGGFSYSKIKICLTHYSPVNISELASYLYGVAFRLK